MASKVQETKDAQGYSKALMQCSNCGNFSSTKTEVSSPYSSARFFVEKNKRCLIGGFAVQSSGSCTLYVRKVG